MSTHGDNSLFPWEPEPADAADVRAAEPVTEPMRNDGDDTESLGYLAAADDDVLHAGRESPGAARRAERPLVRKEYYSISEVADLVGLPAHVLRYWESQFSVLNPSKNRSGNRVYQRKEIRLILLVKQLLYDEKYTVEGAKQKLEQLRRGGGISDATTTALDTQLVRVMRDELRSLLKILAPDVE